MKRRQNFWKTLRSMEMLFFCCRHFPSEATQPLLLKYTTLWKSSKQPKGQYFFTPLTWKVLPSSGELRVWRPTGCHLVLWSLVLPLSCVRMWSSMASGLSQNPQRRCQSATTIMTTSCLNRVSMQCPKNTTRSFSFMAKAFWSCSLVNVNRTKKVGPILTTRNVFISLMCQGKTCVTKSETVLSQRDISTLLSMKVVFPNKWKIESFSINMYHRVEKCFPIVNIRRRA